MFRTNALRTRDIRDFEEENARLSRSIANESIVLLKNNGVLPLKNKVDIALYGEGAPCTIKGGTGSGEVNARYVISIWQGLKNAGFNVTTDKWLNDYKTIYLNSKFEYIKKMRRESGWFKFSIMESLMGKPFKSPAGMEITEEYLSDSEYCIYVLTRQAGEEMDRLPEKGDFLITDEEMKNIKTCTKHYKHTIIVINVGGYIDLSPLDEMNIDAILFFCQQGSEGGNALADIISGRVVPSGKLASTWMKSYNDVPFGEKYSIIDNNVHFEDYSEGIYVGYRYYDSFNIEPKYPFGFGLSYTEFGIESSLAVSGTKVTVKSKVANIGNYKGKETVQVYVSCPKGKLDKEYQRLAGFAKTSELIPNASCDLEISFDLTELTSFDEKRDSFILEKGKYIVRIGNNSRNTKIVGAFELEDEVIVSKHDKICAPEKDVAELHNATEIEEDISSFEPIIINTEGIITKEFEYNEIEPPKSEKIDQLLSKLREKDLHCFCAGTGIEMALPKHHNFIVPGACGYTTGQFEKKGIPAIAFSDGPAGLHLFDESVIRGRTVRMTKPLLEYYDFLPVLARKAMIKKPREGKMLYQYATAFPVAMALAQTWNLELANSFGRAIQREMEAFGVQVWLAPGVNIHRNPLCGRNYEYYSEDPYLSGNMASAVISGAQHKKGYIATLKHYCCNNQEFNRAQINVNISLRALREIYLRNFEYAMKAKPMAVMTSYNKLNGLYTAENYGLVTKILRNEWGFNGLIMTDWIVKSSVLDSGKVLNAGVNIMMPGISSDHKEIDKAIKQGTLSQETVKKSASYVLQTIAGSALLNKKD